MSFHTPQNTATRDQPPITLLFSPPFKSGDGSKSPAFGRSPSGTPTPFSQSFARDQQTPPSRRRSLTPASSIAKDTPPPPPVDSILDSPGLAAGPSVASWATQQPQQPDHGGVEDMSTSPIGGGAGQQQQQQQMVAAPLSQPPSVAAATAGIARDYAAAGRALRDYESTWVTVFGFSQGDVPLVLREFGKCGDIVQFGTFEDGPHCNWLHINYANKHAAQRALLRSGDQLSMTCMVGVKPLEAGKKELIERQIGTRTAGNRGPALPKVAGARSYQVNAAAAQAAVVPLSSKSAWEKVSEFILGI